jgi:hypothetical protein
MSIVDTPDNWFIGMKKVKWLSKPLGVILHENDSPSDWSYREAGPSISCLGLFHRLTKKDTKMTLLGTICGYTLHKENRK